jgi:hypothetical protein
MFNQSPQQMVRAQLTGGANVHGASVEAGSGGAQRKPLVLVRFPRQICTARSVVYKPDGAESAPKSRGHPVF